MIRRLLLSLLTITFLSAHLNAETGISANRIVLGQSCTLGGPAAAQGREIATGMRAYFDYMNNEGGLDGRRIELITLDDRGEPKRAMATTSSLLTAREAFLLIGSQGTETSLAVLPIINQEKVPFLAPVSGDRHFREPFSKWVFNLRGSHAQEIDALIAYLVDDRGLSKIACFFQDNDLGKAGYKQFKSALKRRNLKSHAKGKYEPGTVAIRKGFQAIESSQPEAVVMIAENEACSFFLRGANNSRKFSGAVFSVAAVDDTESLKAELGELAEGLIVSQVVPDPNDESLALVKQFQELMRAGFQTQFISYRSLEGFMAAKLFCMVVDDMEGDITRESFVTALEKTGPFDLGGVVLTFGQRDHQGMDNCYIVELRGNDVPLVSE